MKKNVLFLLANCCCSIFAMNQYPRPWEKGYDPNRPTEYTRRLAPSEVCSVKVRCQNPSCGAINIIIYPCNDSNPAPVSWPCRECGYPNDPLRTVRPFESKADWNFNDSRVVKDEAPVEKKKKKKH